jgi:hypothetical protein
VIGPWPRRRIKTLSTTVRGNLADGLERLARLVRGRDERLDNEEWERPSNWETRHPLQQWDERDR